MFIHVVSISDINDSFTPIMAFESEEEANDFVKFFGRDLYWAVSVPVVQKQDSVSHD